MINNEMGFNPNGKRNVTLDQTTEVVCDKCGNNIMIDGAMYRKVSKILTGNVQDSYVPIPVPFCFQCGHVNEEFVPVEVRKPKLIL